MKQFSSKKCISVVLALIMVLIPLTVFAGSPDAEAEMKAAMTSDGKLNPDKLDCGGAILVDAYTGQVLFEKNADQQYFPASITKIMTCLLVLEYVEEHPDVLNSTVTIEKNYVLEENASNIGTRIGEEFNFKDLLYGLMLASGNEIGIILGEVIDGDLDTFINHMNARAQELGMTNTHYNNPHGLNDPTHLTTARDQALLAVEAMKNPMFREIVATDVYTCPATNKSDARRWSNHNKLMLGETSDDSEAYDKAIGVKTGYTSKAKCTLVSAARMEETGEEYIAVCMYGTNSAARFKSCRIMLEYAFQHYDQLDASLYLDLFAQKDVPAGEAEEGTETFVPVANAEKDALLSFRPEANGPLYITAGVDEIADLKENPTASLRLETELRNDLTAPVAAGDTIGSYRYFYGDKLLGEGSLKADNEVAEKQGLWPDNRTQETDENGQVVPSDEAKPEKNPTMTKLIILLIMLLIIAVLIIILVIHIVRLSRSIASSRHSTHRKKAARSSSRGRSERKR